MRNAVAEATAKKDLLLENRYEKRKTMRLGIYRRELATYTIVTVVYDFDIATRDAENKVQQQKEQLNELA
jgi:hypothetical protein